jgi:hypothetical protein
MLTWILESQAATEAYIRQGITYVNRHLSDVSLERVPRASIAILNNTPSVMILKEGTTSSF